MTDTMIAKAARAVSDIPRDSDEYGNNALHIVRAVLKAIRTPDEEMLAIGGTSAGPIHVSAWRDMVDYILAEEPT